MKPFANGIVPRQGYAPARWVVRPIDQHSDDPGSPAPVVYEPAARTLAADVELRLGYDAQALHVLARWPAEEVVVRPELPAEGASFWKQDHIDVRFAPDPDDPGRQVVFMFAADGRWWSSDLADDDANASGVRAEGKCDDGVCEIRSAIGWDALGLGKPAPGDVWRGLVSRITWQNGYHRIASAGDVGQGLGQVERFCELAFVDNTAAPTLLAVQFAGDRLAAGPVDANVLLEHRGATTWMSGRLRYGGAAGLEARACVRRVQLTPGQNSVPVVVRLPRSRYERLHVDAELDGVTYELGAFSLRASLSSVPGHAAQRQRPGLLFDAEQLKQIRERFKREPLSRMAAANPVTEQDLDPPKLPPEGASPSLLIDADAMNWFRVGKETMLRDGAGGRRKTAAYLWARQSPEAQQTWRDVVEAIQPTDAQVQLLCDEWNRLLAQRDFYDAQAFAGVALPHEAQQMLEAGLDKLDDQQLFRFNRMVLQNSVECIRCFRLDLAGLPGNLLVKWLMHGDDRLIAAATRSVRAANQAIIVGPYTDLHEGGISTNLALCYDCWADQLSDDDRAEWIKLMRRFLQLHLYTARRLHWNCTTNANANPVCNGGGGLLALSLLDELPDEADESLDHARRLIWNWLDYCNGDDGGNTEGMQYWQYGTENFVRFALALERVTSSDDGLMQHPSIVNMLNMVRVGLCPDGSTHGLNDTIPLPVGGELAWLAGRRYGDALGAWYGDHAMRQAEARAAANHPAPYRPAPLGAALFRPNLPEQFDPPTMDRAYALPSIEYAIVRSQPRYDAPLAAGLKGSRPPYTHHNQPDTGAMFVHLRGDRLLIDPGYHTGNADQHCLPFIDGAAPRQPSDYRGRITQCEAAGDYAWITCDATPAYHGAADRVQRTIVLVGDAAAVVVDDIIATGDGRIEMLYQAGGPTADVGDNSVEITGPSARCRLSWPGAYQPQVELKPHEPYRVHWGYNFSNTRRHPIVAQYQAAAGTPLVTLVSDATDGQPLTAEVTDAASQTIDRMALRLSDGRELALVRTPAGWRPGVADAAGH